MIEVALPLDDINEESAREKSIRHGHPSTIHLWWARRPLAAARAVLFSQLVNDPGFERHLGRGVNKQKAQEEREKLFDIIRRLVKWDNLTDQNLLDEAKNEIMKSWRETCALNKDHPQAKELFNPEVLPAFHDPFSGGGAIPLEAQRLGLHSYASDLNPIPVIINKALIDIPNRFLNKKPISSMKEDKYLGEELSQENCLQTDLEYYGKKLFDVAFKNVSSFYEDVEITSERIREQPSLLKYKGRKLKVVAWLWSRTVKSPNPAYSNTDVPLVSSFWLSSKRGCAWVEPIIHNKSFKFVVRNEGSPIIEETVNRKGATCIFSNTKIDFKYIREEGKKGNIGQRLMAIVAEGDRERVYITPTEADEILASSVPSSWKPTLKIPENPRDFKTPNYGLTTFGDLFTPRQLFAINTFIDSLSIVKNEIIKDANDRNWADLGLSLEEDGNGIKAYSEALILYLAMLIDQVINHSSNVCGWNSVNAQMRSVFARQAIPMVWDFAEVNIFSNSSGSYLNLIERMVKGFEKIGFQNSVGVATQADAVTQEISKNKVISTDPPYYDNICYADLSDFFYVWLRKTVKDIYPSLFSTMAVPKVEELIAAPYRHGGKESAESFFISSMTKAITRLAEIAHPAFPITIYYAFKQSEADGDIGDISSSGWETFLEAILKSGFSISGTWPIRTEKQGRVVGNNANALASSVVLVCKKRDAKSKTISRREFIRELNETLPNALTDIMNGGQISPIAPVDLSQAIIGPGMEIFSKYATVIEADGRPMTVKTALQLINRFLAEDDFDLDTQFCLNWFETNGWTEGLFGQADVLARAKGTSVEGLRDGGVAKSSAGKFSLIKWQDLDEDWSPETDSRTSHWEMLHHLIRAYNKNGESVAGEILARIHSKSETIRALAYRLYTVCERKKYADDAANYNNLILAWESIEMSAQSVGVRESQISLFDSEPETKETTKKTKRKK